MPGTTEDSRNIKIKITHCCSQVAHKQGVTKIGISNTQSDIKAQRRTISPGQGDHGRLPRKDEV